MPICKNREYRALQTLTAPQNDDTEFRVQGYATTFNSPYVLYNIDGTDYSEIIDRHALDNADMSDVIMQYDHSGKVYARQSNQTLQLNCDEQGLHITADLSKSQASKELYEEIHNGLITKMSWAFTVTEDSYDRETHTRTILKVGKVYDVSAVSIPANDDTDIKARSFFNGEIEKEKQELLELNKRRLKLKMEVNN